MQKCNNDDGDDKDYDVDLSHIWHFFEFFDACIGKHVLGKIMKDGFGPERLRFAKTLLGAKIWLKIWKRHNFHNLGLKYINMGV